MPSVQEQYTQVVQQSQEAVLAAVDSWTRTVQDAAGRLPVTPSGADPTKVIDQVFDFAGKMLEMQRDFAKNLVKTSASAVDTATQRTTADAQTAADQL
jgi:hypothetical protein